MPAAVRPTGWNPYYLAYAADTGAEHPDEVFRRDGSNAPYIAWIHRQWEAWRAETGYRGVIGDAERTAFGAWLANRYPFPPAWGIAV